MPQTLGELIASRDFTGYASASAWFLEAQDIEKLLHHRSYESFSMADEHLEAFCAAEDFIAVELDTWICTDTLVGLHLICLNGTGVALSWQTGRKEPLELMLLSEGARDEFVERWDAHRPRAAKLDVFVDPATFGLPVARPGQDRFSVDEGAPIESMRPSLSGVSQWLAAIEKDGGLASVSNRDTLTVCRAGAEADAKMARQMLSLIAKYPPEDRAEIGESLDEEETSYRAHLRFVEESIIAPLDQRIKELTEQ